jgi:hypothetical protein
MQKEVVTRNEVREMGINVSSTQFLRYEQAGLLTPLKVGRYQSAVVRYSLEQVRALFLFRSKS